MRQGNLTPLTPKGKRMRLLLLGCCLLMPLSLLADGPPDSNEYWLTVSRDAYRDQLAGFWLGGCIANWTGLATENARANPPFFTDEDWGKPRGHGGKVIDFVLDDDPWKADDDTDIEYVYQHAMEHFDTHRLNGAQISEAWRKHIALPLLWVSNLAALGQMQNGAEPPETSLPDNNPMWDMIDAQLTTELFGALSPGRPDIALELARLPIRTTAYMHSQWAAEFYVIMHALVPLADPGLSRAEQVWWLAEQARRRLPTGSYITAMYDFVKADFEANPDKDDWERTRDRLYEHFQVQGASGYVYKYPWDSGINFGASIISLFYGGGDFRRTVQIATLAGWDSDNPTATWGGLLGLLYGHQGLEEYFGKTDFSDHYWIERTRPGLPRPTDRISEMADRGVGIIDRVVSESMGGVLEGGNWRIPGTGHSVEGLTTPPEPLWTVIEDNDAGWSYKGFKTREEQWHASGGTLTFGGADCRAEYRFVGSAVQYYAWRSSDSGSVTVFLDGEMQEEISLFSDASPHGQFYIKVFDKRDLQPGEHTLTILCDDSDAPKTIDLLSIIRQ